MVLSVQTQLSWFLSMINEKSHGKSLQSFSFHCVVVAQLIVMLQYSTVL